MLSPGLLLPLLLPLLLGPAAGAEGEAPAREAGESTGNFMEDEQWLSSISQYSGKIKHWNRFRDLAGGRQGLNAEGGGNESWKLPQDGMFI
ncbi:testican-2-like [Lissotriton helveticus]